MSLAPVSAGIYSSSQGSEPGLIMLSDNGEIRFWENMSLALANVDRCQVLQIDLGRGERADKIWRVEVG